MKKLIQGQRMGGHKALAVAGIVGILLIALAFTLRAKFVDRDADKLCTVLYTMIASSGATLGTPGSAGYAYYQEHPDELANAREQNDAFLKKLPCTLDLEGTPP